MGFPRFYSKLYSEILKIRLALSYRGEGGGRLMFFDPPPSCNTSSYQAETFWLLKIHLKDTFYNSFRFVTVWAVTIITKLQRYLTEFGSTEKWKFWIIQLFTGICISEKHGTSMHSWILMALHNFWIKADGCLVLTRHKSSSKNVTFLKDVFIGMPHFILNFSVLAAW